MTQEVLDTLLWIELAQPEDFLKVKETLTRIGVAAHKEKKLYQSCHILHKRGRYAIVHFKEMFALDGKPTDFSDDDSSRRNTIASLLEQWGLLKILDPKTAEPKAPVAGIKILPFKEKGDWELIPKYRIGVKKGK